MRSVTISHGTTFTGQTGSTTTLAGAMLVNGTLDAAGGVINATTGFSGTGTARIGAGGTLNIAANSTIGTLTHNGTTAGSLNLGASNITVSADYTNGNFGTGNSFDKHANVSTIGGQILAAGPNTNVMQVITGAKVANGDTAAPTLDIGILHKGDTTSYQIANQGTAANPSLRGAIQTNVNGGNITGGLLTGTGVTPGNFGPIAPGSSTGTFEVTALAPGILQGQAVHVANNFDNVREQTMAITGQINNFAALAFVNQGGQGSLTDSFILDFGQVAQGSQQIAMLGMLNDNPLADQQFTDLLTSMIIGMTGSGFDLTGCSVTGLAGGDAQSGCEVSFDTSDVGDFLKTVTFSVESINADFDGFLTPVVLTIEGTVVGMFPPVPEPGTMAMLASGLGMTFLVFGMQRRRRR